MEQLIQGMLDTLGLIMENVVKSNDATLILEVTGLIKEIGTDLKIMADNWDLDVEPRTPID